MICITVMKPTTDEALAAMARASSRCDILELRLDSITEPDMAALFAPGHRLIVTNRRKDEGGHFTGTEESRIDLLCEAVSLGAVYVDVELATEPDLARRVERARTGTQTKLIVSYHDFRTTPSLERLRGIAGACCARGADIVKIATHVRRVEDNLTILRLLHHAKKEKIPMAAFCMDSAGRLSRIAAPLFGSMVSYVAAGAGEESAPGQLTVEEMSTIMEILGR